MSGLTEPEDKEREAIRRLPCELCGITHGDGSLCHDQPLDDIDEVLTGADVG